MMKLSPISRQPPPRRSRSFTPAATGACSSPPVARRTTPQTRKGGAVPAVYALAAMQAVARVRAVTEAIRAMHAALETPRLRRTTRISVIRARPAAPTSALPPASAALRIAQPQASEPQQPQRTQSLSGDGGELARCKTQISALATLVVRQRDELERLRAENADLRATLQRLEDDLPTSATSTAKTPSALTAATDAQGWVWRNHVHTVRDRMTRSLGARPLPSTLVARNILQLGATTMTVAATPMPPTEQIQPPSPTDVRTLSPSTPKSIATTSAAAAAAAMAHSRRPSHDPSPFFEVGCTEGFKLELGTTSSLTRLGVELTDRVLYETPFETRVATNPHFTFVGWISPTSVAIVSICCEPDPSLGAYEAVLRTEDENNRLLYIDPGWLAALGTKIPKQKAFLKALQTLEPSLSKVRFVQVTAPQLVTELVAYEKRLVVTHTKIGVLYVREGQTDESAMFANTETSADFEEFLGLLGDRITLKGWTHFNGDLDTHENATGSESVFRVWKGIEVMFHVSTLLPFSNTDSQQIARKSKIGNDIVVIVFKEGNTPFPVHRIKSTFSQVYILVQPLPSKLYRMSVATKSGIAPYPPFLHEPPHFPRNEDFINFLLTKCLNAEQTSMKSATFATKMQNVRRASLQAIARKYAPSPATSKQGSFKK